MKSSSLMISALLFSALAATGYCAMGTGKALPKSWNNAAGRGYPAFTALSGNPGSTMCVECHYANPSRTIPISPLPAGDSPQTETNYRGSHYVINNFAGGLPAKIDPAKQGAQRDTVWGSGAFSKYASFPDGLNPVNLPDGVRGELICESCHNLATNVATSGSNSLLLGDFSVANGVSTLCGDCHAAQAAHPPDHHRMSGDTVGKESSCPGTGLPTCSDQPHALNIDHTIHLLDKNAVQAAKPNTLGVGYFLGEASEMTCQSCHTPHRALTWTGGRIMRRGTIMVDSSDKPVNVVYGPFETYNRGDVVPRSTADHGLHRQSEMTGGKRLVVNSDPLCASCHK